MHISSSMAKKHATPLLNLRVQAPYMPPLFWEDGLAGGALQTSPTSPNFQTVEICWVSDSVEYPTWSSSGSSTWLATSGNGHDKKRQKMFTFICTQISWMLNVKCIQMHQNSSTILYYPPKRFGNVLHEFALCWGCLVLWPEHPHSAGNSWQFVMFMWCSRLQWQRLDKIRANVATASVNRGKAFFAASDFVVLCNYFLQSLHVNLNRVPHADQSQFTKQNSWNRTKLRQKPRGLS